jgi:plastin-1
MESRKSKYDIDVKLTMGFSPQQYTEYETVFKSLDINKDGSISHEEITKAMHHLGFRNMSDGDVEKMIAEVDLNNNKEVEFEEFLLMMKKFNETGKETNFTKIVNKAGANMFKIGDTQSSAFSTFSEEERSAYVRVINSVLADDEICKKYLPIDPMTMDIFAALKNGIILCKLINRAQPGTIDERVINIKENMNVFLIAENLKLALNAAKAIGCQVINIFPDTIIDQKFALILGLLWQIIKLIILGELSIKKHPELVRLLKDGESLTDLLKLHPEDILLRWFNYHLTAAGYDKKISNFSSDVKDGEKYTILLNQLNSSLCDKTALQETDLTKRANKVLQNSKKLGVESYIVPSDITNGNSKLNTLFTAAIFNHCHGLDPPTEEEAYEAAKLDEDEEGNREERAFRHWINALGLEDVHVTNLYENCRSGVLLLKVIDKIKPGSVNWKVVDQNSDNKFKKIANCNEAVTACKKAGLTIVGIGGTDIHDANKKLILAIVWQLMRSHTLQVLGNKTEEDLLKWANEMVGKEYAIGSLKEKGLKNSLYFIRLMSAIEPRAINWDLVDQSNLNCLIFR